MGTQASVDRKVRARSAGSFVRLTNLTVEIFKMTPRRVILKIYSGAVLSSELSSSSSLSLLEVLTRYSSGTVETKQIMCCSSLEEQSCHKQEQPHKQRLIKRSK
jgi:hypothetical protein